MSFVGAPAPKWASLTRKGIRGRWSLQQSIDKLFANQSRTVLSTVQWFPVQDRLDLAKLRFGYAKGSLGQSPEYRCGCGGFHLILTTPEKNIQNKCPTIVVVDRCLQPKRCQLVVRLREVAGLFFLRTTLPSPVGSSAPTGQYRAVHERAINGHRTGAEVLPVIVHWP